MKQQQIKESDIPFIVHYDDVLVIPRKRNTFPTHTHGLSKVGFPEMFIDPLAFGPGNSNLIKTIYSTLKLGDKKDLESLFNGEVLTFRHPSKGNICIREVSKNFQGVKCAYEHDLDEHEILENSKFLQIWVDGDDYVLMDSYYIDGVDW
jgi:hypothetical protein